MRKNFTEKTIREYEDVVEWIEKTFCDGRVFTVMDVFRSIPGTPSLFGPQRSYWIVVEAIRDLRRAGLIKFVSPPPGADKRPHYYVAKLGA